MIRHGDTFINFNKVKGTQMADIQMVIKKRPKTKFSTGLSLEAQEAMQQVMEEAKIEQSARKGKRGSKGNVLFSDKVQICKGSTTRTLGILDLLKENSTASQSPRSPRIDGGELPRRSSLSVSTTLTGRPGSLSLAVDQVEIANRPARERKSSRAEEGKKEIRMK